MADPQTNTTSEDTNGSRRRPDGEPASSAGAQERSFAASEAAPRGAKEAVGNAKELSNIAARATREVGEQSRQAAHEAATSWQGAVEPFLGMQMEMSRWFDDLWRQATGFGVLPALRTARPFAGLSAAPMFGLPPADVKETDKAYALCLEVPGMAREDIEIQVRGDALLISGQKAQEREDASATYRLSERRFGRFDRSFPIPPDAAREHIEAEVRDGVLKITLPKTEDAGRQRTRIEIKG
jgi:HSP20 family protein